MAVRSLLDRLAALDTNTVSDALDFLGLPGATFGIRPLWNCPKIVGRASTIQLAPKADGQLKAHIITPVIAGIDTDDRVLVITGGLEGISCWGDIIANAAQFKRVRGTVIDGVSRDIEGSESIGYPVYGRGITMISARNRLAQLSAGAPVAICRGGRATGRFRHCRPVRNGVRPARSRRRSHRTWRAYRPTPGRHGEGRARRPLGRRCHA